MAPFLNVSHYSFKFGRPCAISWIFIWPFFSVATLSLQGLPDWSISISHDICVQSCGNKGYKFVSLSSHSQLKLHAIWQKKPFNLIIIFQENHCLCLRPVRLVVGGVLHLHRHHGLAHDERGRHFDQ